MKKLIAIILALSLITMFSACKKEPIDKNGVYRDDCISFTLPTGYLVFLDSTEDMGAAYNAFLTFKYEDSISPDNIMYFSALMSEQSADAVSTEKDEVVKKFKDQFEKQDKTFELVSFSNLDVEGARGYVIEYKATSDDNTITHILYSAVTENNMVINVYFNCHTPELLEFYRASCESIELVK